LQLLQEIDPERKVAVARELTKTFEECLRGTPADLIAHFGDSEIRGEIILLISEGAPPADTIDVEELVSIIQEILGYSLKDAIKTAAKWKGLPKSDVYRQIHSTQA